MINFVKSIFTKLKINRKARKNLKKYSEFHNYANEIYQQVADNLVNIIPVDWNKILLNAEIFNNGVSVYFVFYDSEKNELKNCNSLVNEYKISGEEIDKLFDEISNLTIDLNEIFTSNDQEKWSTFNFTLENTGKFEVNFEYNNFSETSINDRRENWKKKYL